MFLRSADKRKQFLIKATVSLLFIASFLWLCSCSPNETDNVNGTAKRAAINIPQTSFTKPVPSACKTTAKHKGIVERFDYNSLDYARDKSQITKTAYIYLPYNYYDKKSKRQYNIVYLLHGLGGNAGFFFNNRSLKNMLDRLIEKGDMMPMIIVSASFYNNKSNRHFVGSMLEVRAFHKEFENNLMPAVEEHYRTYATSPSKNDLKLSRDHRAFGGFSLGSVTTWMQFCYNSDYIRWYLPMSGSCWYYGTFGNFQTEKNVKYLEKVVKKHKLQSQGYFIYFTTGTNDEIKDQSIMQAEEMLKHSNVFTPEHFVFYQKEGGAHDINAVQEYLYNALPLFFQYK